MLDKDDAVDRVRELLAMRHAESEKLNRLHAYWRGTQDLPSVPAGVPAEVKKMAEMSRVNVLSLVVDVVAQSMFVSGFRQQRAADDDEGAWAIWQANKMDARQIGVHRAVAAYGVSYVMALPGDPHTVLRGVSPRRLTAAYGDDDDWPLFALEVVRRGKAYEYRLFDDEAKYVVMDEPEYSTLELSQNFQFVGAVTHGMGVCPVVRFRNHEDLDDEVTGELEALIPLQDQIDFTTFGLLVTQFYQAFRQRYVLGWTSPDETTKAKASAARLWTFDDDNVKVGEFSQADLSGYLESRQATVEQLATISQTPPHQLLGKMINLSAEALAAAEAGHRRKIAERETTWGESWEQALRLAASAEDIVVDDDAQVRWRDTEARSLSQTVDALGKLAQMLGVPPQELWERVPGVTDQDLKQWRSAAAGSDSLGNLAALLEGQMAAGAGEDPAEVKAKADALGALIRAGVAPADAAVRVGLPGIEFTGAVPVSLRLPKDEADEVESRGGRDSTGRAPPGA